MEIIIGMVLAFVAGAYIRKPFVLWRKAEPEALQGEEKESDELTLEKQLNNMLNFNGEIQE